MRKLMWFAIGFALAMAVGIYFLQGTQYFPAAGIAAVLLAAILLLQKRFPVARIAAVVGFGLVVGLVWAAAYDSFYLAVPRAADGLRAEMTVTATDYTEQTDYGLAVDGVATINGRRYRVRAYFPDGVSVAPGDKLTGRFSLRSTLPGGSAESTYSASDRVFLTAKLSRAPTVDKAEKLPWYGYPAYARQWVASALSESLPADTAGFAVALLLGDKSGLDYETQTDFKISGISHIVAVSGLHVSILFSLVYFLTGRKRLPALLIGLPTLVFFAAMAGFTPSIVRACMMHGLMLFAMLFKKEYDPPTALSFAALTMLAINPWTITSVGFQLSVACVSGILLFARPITDWLMDPKRLGRWKGRRRKLVNGICVSVGVSLSATVFVTPLCAYYYHMVSLAGVLTNHLTLWAVSLCFYGIVAVAAAALIWPFAAGIAGWLVSWPIRYVLAVAAAIASFPLSAVYTDSIYVVMWLIFVYILLAAFLLCGKKQVVALLCSGIFSLCLVLLISWTEPARDEYRLTVLDVGQGQCIVLQSRGKTYMVDCGGDSDTRAADTAANALLSQGIFRVDGMILTHYDRDHAGGVPYLTSRVETQMLYLPAGDETQDLLGDDQTCFTVSEVTTIRFADATITLIPAENALSDNESSMCILFQTENCAILITGDQTAAGERALMRRIDLPQLDVLIVGHHGSKTSTAPSLLAETQPRLAIISVGQDNSYGHPSQEVLERLEDAGCTVCRTDIHGTIIYRG